MIKKFFVFALFTAHIATYSMQLAYTTDLYRDIMDRIIAALEHKNWQPELCRALELVDKETIISAIKEHGFNAVAANMLLFFVARHNYTWLLSSLEKHIINIDTPVDVYDAPYESKQNIALHIAARYGHIKVVDWLINHGAGIFTRNIEGDTALHLAVYHDHVAVAELLITRKPSAVNQKKIYKINGEVQTLSPLGYVVRNGSPKMRRLFGLAM